MKREVSHSGAYFKLRNCIAGECSGTDDLPQQCRFSRYWNRKEIENNSSSRKDGIDMRKESQLRMIYCSFLQDIGMRLGVPQVTIATAMMFCHRFYLHQSHAKNEWQRIKDQERKKHGHDDEHRHASTDTSLIFVFLVYIECPWSFFQVPDASTPQILECACFLPRNCSMESLSKWIQRFIMTYNGIMNALNMGVYCSGNLIKTIATVCMFLASKVEDTPCHLNKVVTMAYEMMYQKDPDAAQRINEKDVFEKQKGLVLIGERLVLCTIRFDFNIQHPYKPLCEAFRELQICQRDVRQTAWNFVNDWLRTTLCLQYKPNYIAAGSLYLAAMHHNVKLPSGCGSVWWQILNIMPQQLDAVVRQMVELLGYKKKPLSTPQPEKPEQVQSPSSTVAKEEALSSPDSCVLNGDWSGSKNDVNDEASNLIRPMDSSDPSSQKLRDSESPNGVVVVCGEINKGIQHALEKINVDRIKALMNMRKRSRDKHVKAVDDCSEEGWIERELEDGVEPEAGILVKKQK